MKKKKVAYFLIICCILSLCGCIKKSVSISLKLKKGDSYKIEMDRREKVTQKIKDSSLEVETKSKISYLCNVTNVDSNKNADIKVTFDAIDIKDNVLGGQTPVAKQKETPENPDTMAKVYSAFLGKSFSVKIGEYGKVKQIIGMDEIVKSIFEELNIKEEKEKEDIKKIIKEKFGEEALTKRIEEVTSVYPNKKVKVGESWDKKVDLSNQIPVEAENKYTLKESEDKTSEITVEAKIKNKEDGEPVIIDKIKITYEEIKGTEKGVINLNEETGFIKHTELEREFSGKMKLYSEDPNLGSQTFPIEVKGKTVVNVLRQ